MALRADWDPYRWMQSASEGFDPVVITCAVNGGVQGQESHPSLPERPEEIAAQAGEAYDAGASIIHIHAREKGNPSEASGDGDDFWEVNALVRERCPEVIINNSTGGSPQMPMEQRFACLQTGPELASLNLGPAMTRVVLPERSAPLVPQRAAEELDNCIPFTYGVVEQLAKRMGENGTRPELEIYQPGHYWVVRELIDRGLIQPPYWHQFVMGFQTSSFPTPRNVLDLLEAMPEGGIFGVCALGPYQLPLTTLSLLLGGHVRVGLEDNLYYSRGRRLRGNGEAVERTVRIASELNRETATPAEARKLLGLSSEPKSFSRARPDEAPEILT